MKAPLYLVDGYSLIYRSYFAFMKKHLINPAGQNSSAVFGFFRTIISLLDSFNPAYLAVVMDSRVPTFRHEIYPPYKANREKAPQDLHDQVPRIESILDAMGIRWVVRDGYEADDIMATLARLSSGEGRSCFIVSGDKDLLQLVDERVRIVKSDKGTYFEADRNAVFAEFGVFPEQIVDYLSLTGDQSDNVPGARGIGPKTASGLLQKYKTLEGIYEHLDEIPEGPRKKLIADRENVFLSRKLIVLKDDVPLDFSVESLTTGDVSPAAAVPLFLKEGMKSLADQLRGEKDSLFARSRGTDSAKKVRTGGSTAGSGGAAGGLNLMKAETDIGSTQPPVTYRPVLDSALLDAVIQQVKRAGVFAFDTETDNLDELIASPVGFSISVKGCEAYYIPVRSPNAACIPEKTVKAGLTKILTDPSLRLIGQNIKFDYKVMKRWGIEMANISFDTMIAAWLLDSDASSYSLDTLSEKVLHVTPLHFTDVVKKGESFADVPIQQATAYSAEDADFTYRLYEVYAPRLEERGLSDLFTRIEMPLVRILAEMELTGIRILPEVLIEFGRELEKELFSLESKIYKECGEEFNINSTQQLSHILFDVRKLKAVKKTKTGFSTDINVLEELAREDVVPGLVLRHRALSKLKSTYVDSLPKLINPETGRLHTRFIQTGTATGRLSSRDPNLQNIPIRDEEGRRIRDAFVPAPGFSFLSADYSQIELVVLAHLSGDPGLKEAFLSGKDVHRNTASLLFGVPEEEVTAEERRIAKTINFGVIYGMSAFRLARDLGIPRAEADKFLASYFGRYSGIRSFIERTVKAAEEEGVVRTILKRERTITGINSRNRTEKMSAERIAVNTPIQGSAADIVKLAMIRVTKRLHSEGLRTRLILQVHDELIFEVPSEEESSAEKIVREEMEHAYPLSVPLRVSIEVGKSWGELH